MARRKGTPRVMREIGRNIRKGTEILGEVRDLLPPPVKFDTVSEGVKIRAGAVAWVQLGQTNDLQRALAAIGTARQLGHRVYVEVDNGVLSFMAD